LAVLLDCQNRSCPALQLRNVPRGRRRVGVFLLQAELGPRARGCLSCPSQQSLRSTGPCAQLVSPSLRNICLLSRFGQHTHIVPLSCRRKYPVAGSWPGLHSLFWRAHAGSFAGDFFKRAACTPRGSRPSRCPLDQTVARRRLPPLRLHCTTTCDPLPDRQCWCSPLPITARRSFRSRAATVGPFRYIQVHLVEGPCLRRPDICPRARACFQISTTQTSTFCWPPTDSRVARFSPGSRTKESTEHAVPLAGGTPGYMSPNKQRQQRP